MKLSYGPACPVSSDQKHPGMLLLRQTSGTSCPAASKNPYFWYLWSWATPSHTVRNTTLMEFVFLPLWTILHVFSVSGHQKCTQTATPFSCRASTLILSFEKRELPSGCCDQPAGTRYLGHQPHSSSAVRSPGWPFVTGTSSFWQPRALLPTEAWAPHLELWHCSAWPQLRHLPALVKGHFLLVFLKLI